MSHGDTLAGFLLSYKLPSFSGLIFVSRKNISPKGTHPQQYKKNKFRTESVYFDFSEPVHSEQRYMKLLLSN